MPNGVDLILADHATVNDLFAWFDATGDATIIGQVIDALTAHDTAEHVALYPFTGNLLGDEKVIQRVAAAHTAVKRQIDLVTSLEGAPLVAAFAELQQLVTAHVKDEEQHVLPQITAAATPQQLEELGARILHAKARGG